MHVKYLCTHSVIKYINCRDDERLCRPTDSTKYDLSSTVNIKEQRVLEPNFLFSDLGDRKM